MEVVMSIPVQEIQKLITALSREDLSRFRRWFETFDARQWDEQFEADVRDGKLDRIAEQAMQEYRAGKFREL